MDAYMCAAGVPDARIDEARKDLLLKIVADLLDDFFDPEAWPSERNTAAECRADLVGAVEFLAIARRSREVTEFILTAGGYNLLVTGGISNSDSPTDAYDWFNPVWHCKRLHRQLEKWATEGYAAKADPHWVLAGNGGRMSIDDASVVVRYYGDDEEIHRVICQGSCGSRPRCSSSLAKGVRSCRSGDPVLACASRRCFAKSTPKMWRTNGSYCWTRGRPMTTCQESSPTKLRMPGWDKTATRRADARLTASL